MSGDKMIPVEESFAEWRKDPDYVKAYNALEDEFSLAAEMIRARASAGLTQEQLAQRMNTTQAVIARLESGRVKPSTRTLERLAAATGMKLRISFEPCRCDNAANFDTGSRAKSSPPADEQSLTRKHGRSMEAEARRILSEAVAGDRDQPEPNLAEAIRRRFAPLGGVDLELPPREFVDEPPSFDP